MNQNKILLIEDDKEISEMLKNYLTVENYEVICAYDGQEACDYFDRTDFSMILLDLMIPKISGMDVMQHIREHSVVPLIIISAKDSEIDKTLGLSLGADDYITKPFSVVEVLARINKERKTGGTHCKRIRNFEAAYATSEKGLYKGTNICSCLEGCLSW